jgi:hypothetical protein
LHGVDCRLQCAAGLEQKRQQTHHFIHVREAEVSLLEILKVNDLVYLLYNASMELTFEILYQVLGMVPVSEDIEEIALFCAY